MNYSLKDIQTSRDASKRYIDKIDIWVCFVVRPIANLLTWLFLKIRLKANTATLISTVVGFLGAILLIAGSSDETLLLGLIVLNLWIVFDCIDGNIARTTRSSSLLGTYLDGISGYFYVSLLYISLGVAVFRHYNLIINGINYGWVYILIGAFTSLECILPRLFEHKAISLFEDYRSKITDKSHYSLFYILGLNLAGMAGLSNPLMIIAYYLHCLNYYLLFYFVIQAGIFLVSFYRLMKNLYTNY